MPYLISLGQPLPGWSAPQREGGQFNIDSDGPMLKLYYTNPVPDEKKAFRFGKAQFGLVKAGRFTTFFIFNIEGVTDGWSDASYALGLVAPENRDIEVRADHLGWLLKMLLVDANTGVVCAMRACTLTPIFSHILDDLVGKQRAILDQFSRPEHDREIAQAYAQWPSPNNMVKDALIIEIGGQKFPKT